jgi:hypothetical protein
LPEKKIKNDGLSVLNSKNQQKNEKDDYGDQVGHHLLTPFLTFSSSLGGNCVFGENFIASLGLDFSGHDSFIY